MNRSAIEWCDHTWNPITGCRHGCPFCYAKTMTVRFSGDVRLNKMAKADYRLVESRDGGEKLYYLDKLMLNETGHHLVYPFGFEPTFHEARMGYLDKLKSGANIFVGAMADLFGEWVPDEWIDKVLDKCRGLPRHNYMFLTKNPSRLFELAAKKALPEGDNFWYGTSIMNPDMPYFLDNGGTYHTFLSIEPIMADFSGFHGKGMPEWIIVGAETGNRKGKVIPEAKWIRNVALIADRYAIPVFMKDSLIPILGESEMRREYPKELLRKEISEKREKQLYTECGSCKKRKRKNEMVALTAHTTRGVRGKQFCFLCRECFEKFCGGMGIDGKEVIRITGDASIHFRRKRNGQEEL